MKWTDERTVDIGIYQNTSRLKDGAYKNVDIKFSEHDVFWKNLHQVSTNNKKKQHVVNSGAQGG